MPSTQQVLSRQLSFHVDTCMRLLTTVFFVHVNSWTSVWSTGSMLAVWSPLQRAVLGLGHDLLRQELHGAALCWPVCPIGHGSCLLTYPPAPLSLWNLLLLSSASPSIQPWMSFCLETSAQAAFLARPTSFLQLSRESSRMLQQLLSG
ncbi:hypothetical protein P7K49_005288 [Saguinus oedipus]|uniref:Uncharacterized protein n=1 Tax=Saguinus oedipus TaxID=9490 RepID=A0ABQ9WAN9_SAGOE|nr:hypothetical protein P7K49_005288 [Saguinus oedipus]